MTSLAFLVGLSLGFALACWIVPLLDDWRIDRAESLLEQARAQADRAQREREEWRSRYERLARSLGGAGVTEDGRG